MFDTERKKCILADFELHKVTIVLNLIVVGPESHLCSFGHICQGSLTWVDKVSLILIAGFPMANLAALLERESSFVCLFVHQRHHFLQQQRSESGMKAWR